MAHSSGDRSGMDKEQKEGAECEKCVCVSVLVG